MRLDIEALHGSRLSVTFHRSQQCRTSSTWRLNVVDWTFGSGMTCLQLYGPLVNLQCLLVSLRCELRAAE